MKSEYLQKAQDSEWVQPRMRRFVMVCCDCGLVHHVNFRIVRVNVRTMRNGNIQRVRRVQFQATRAPRLTAQMREHRNRQTSEAEPARRKPTGRSKRR
jgi:hypothetical protein